MIINTGMRTDIPAYFSEWFFNRIKEGYVLARNPYYTEQVTKYRLEPDVVDILSFCTKNPKPMLNRMDEISQFRQFWFVTITPYGKEIEPNVPPKEEVIESFKQLSGKIGIDAVAWRYDPIFLSDKYDMDFHIRQFEIMAKQLCGYTHQCVISFIDLYAKTKRNFHEVKEVTAKEQQKIVTEFVRIGKKYGLVIRTCYENKELKEFGADTSGCMTKQVMEKAIGCTLQVPQKKKSPRNGCNCLLGNDIGMYNTCGHACVYCYANYDRNTVVKNVRQHNPESPFLIGSSMEGDVIREARQESYINGQLSLHFSEK